MKMVLKRDKVISIVKGKDLVGVYFEMPKGIRLKGREVLLGEMPPKKADAIIKLWNSK